MRFYLVLTLFLSAASLVLADWAADLSEFNLAFKSESAEVRIQAVKALKGADHAEGANTLVGRYLCEPDSRVREALAGALADLRTEQACAVVRKAILEEPSEDRRALLCGLLANGRRLDRAELLKSLLADVSEKVRVAACSVVSPSDVSIIPLITGAAKEGMREASVAAMQALGRVNSIEATQALIDSLRKDADAQVKAAAIAALVRMSDRNFGEEPESWQDWLLGQRAKEMTPVDRAIFLGAANLKAQLAIVLKMPGARAVTIEGKYDNPNSLVPPLVYALHHAGVPNDDPVMTAGVAFMKSMPLNLTYQIAFQALALADMDPKAHAGRLFEIAQALADQQCVNGQWAYGHNSPLTVSAGAPAETSPRFRVVWNELKREPEGDGSNSQFAILALRATMEAGVDLPRTLWLRSLDWYTKHEGQEDGEGRRRRPGQDVATLGPPGGWGYSSGNKKSRVSLSCSGICAVTICMRALGRDATFRNGKPEGEPMIARGIAWLKGNWDLFGSSGRDAVGQYYEQYSLERVGMILDLPKIAGHDWYQEGVDRLIPLQSPHGSWNDSALDTALAILFLRKATHGYPSDPKDK